MSGSPTGGKKAAQTNMSKYGDDFYIRIGKMGGSIPNKNKGFASLPKWKVREIASKGGSARRGWTKYV